VKAHFSQPIAELNGQINALDVRGRVLVLIAGLAVVYGVTALGILPVLNKSQSKIETSITTNEQKLADTNAALKSLESAAAGQSDGATHAKIIALQAKQAEEDARRSKLSSQLVTAKDMTALVENLLANNRQVEVLALRNSEPTPEVSEEVAPEAVAPPSASQLLAKVLNPTAKDLGERAPVKAPPVETPLSQIGVHKHVMTIEVKGRYWDIARLLKSMEDQPKKLLWGEVKLVTEAYPFSTAAITIYTLNLESAWIAI